MLIGLPVDSSGPPSDTVHESVPVYTQKTMALPHIWSDRVATQPAAPDAVPSGTRKEILQR